MSIERKFWKITRWARAARFWLVLLAVVASFFLGLPARAANTTSETREEAYAKCAVAKGASGTESRRIGPNECTRATSGNTNRYQCRYEVSPVSGQTPPVYSTCDNHYWTVQCPADPPGLEWNESAKKCISSEQCLQRNGAANGMPAIQTSRPFSEKCVSGCQLKMEGPGSCTSIFGQSGSTMCAGVFQYSGAMCEAGSGDPNEPPPPPESDETCRAATGDAGGSSGVQVCKKKDGRECVSTKSGASICWGTHETGEKSLGNEQQTRGAGSDEPTPTPPTPPETFDPGQKTDPVTTTTTTTNPNGSTTTTTTTTVSNGTTNGTQPPGTPVAPGGGGGGGQGDDDEDGNSASGGGDCDTPPVVEGDAALGMIALQTWESRCALEKISEGSEVSGDVGDCNSPFTVEGNDANAQRLRAMRAQICPGGESAANGDGDAIDWSGIDGPDSAEGLGLIVEEEIGEDGLDTTGLGFSRSCPVMPQVQFFGTAIQFDNSVMCEWLELGGQILLVLAALASVRIMAGVGT